MNYFWLLWCLKSPWSLWAPQGFAATLDSIIITYYMHLMFKVRGTWTKTPGWHMEIKDNWGGRKVHKGLASTCEVRWCAEHKEECKEEASFLQHTRFHLSGITEGRKKHGETWYFMSAQTPLEPLTHFCFHYCHFYTNTIPLGLWNYIQFKTVLPALLDFWEKAAVKA